MTEVALVLAGAALAVAMVALLVGIRAYDVAMQLQAVAQNPRSRTAREPVRLHLAAKPALGNFDALRAPRRSAAQSRTIQ
jgi:hypothetical protein